MYHRKSGELDVDIAVYIKKNRGICAVKGNLGKSPFRAEIFHTRAEDELFGIAIFHHKWANTSTQTALNQFFKNVLKETVHMSQQALSKARSHFGHSPFSGMFAEVNGMRFSGWHKVRKWNGYQILAVDGSDIALPNTPELHRIFGGSGRNADFPTAKASIMLDICKDFIIDACLEPYGDKRARDGALPP